MSTSHTKLLTLPAARVSDSEQNPVSCCAVSGGGGSRTPKGLRPPHFECHSVVFRNVAQIGHLLPVQELRRPPHYTTGRPGTDSFRIPPADKTADIQAPRHTTFLRPPTPVGWPGLGTRAERR